MLQLKHLFRAFFSPKNDVMCSALWRHLTPTPHQFLMFEDVGDWQPCTRQSTPPEGWGGWLCFCKSSSPPTKAQLFKRNARILTGQDVKNSRRCKDYVKFSWSEARKVLRAKKRKQLAHKALAKHETFNLPFNFGAIIWFNSSFYNDHRHAQAVRIKAR